MHFLSTAALLSVATTVFAKPIDIPIIDGGIVRTPCTEDQQIEVVEQEIRTIISHDPADAAKIPYAPLASRTFIIMPEELQKFYPVGLPVNAGVTAEGVRAVLVSLGTILDAGVPGGPDNGANYTINGNGTVTVDFIQTDRIALPRVFMREIHSIDKRTCQITKIIGYIIGDLE